MNFSSNNFTKYFQVRVFAVQHENYVMYVNLVLSNVFIKEVSKGLISRIISSMRVSTLCAENQSLLYECLNVSNKDYLGNFFTELDDYLALQNCNDNIAI